MHYIWSNSFQDNGHQTWKGRHLERWETNVTRSRNTLRQFPGCTIWGGRIWRETGRPPSTEDTELCLSSQDRALERKESCKEGASWRVAEDLPLAFSQVLTSTCTPKPGRNHSKGLEVAVSSAHQRAGNSACAHQPAWRSSRFMGAVGGVHSSVSP